METRAFNQYNNNQYLNCLTCCSLNERGPGFKRNSELGIELSSIELLSLKLLVSGTESLPTDISVSLFSSLPFSLLLSLSLRLLFKMIYSNIILS